MYMHRERDRGAVKVWRGKEARAEPLKLKYGFAAGFILSERNIVAKLCIGEPVDRFRIRFCYY